MTYPPQPDPNDWHGQQPQYGQPQYGQPQYEQPQYGQQPPYGQPQYEQPQYGQPQYGQPQYEQPQYGQQPPPGQPQYDQYGQPQYGNYQQYPPQGGPPPPRRQTGLIVAAVIALAVVLLGGGGVTVWLLSRDGGPDTAAPSPSSTATSGAPDGTPTPTATAPTGNAGGARGEEALKSLAVRYFDALNARNEPVATQLTCDKTNAGVLWTALTADIKIEFDRLGEITEDFATVFYRPKDRRVDVSAPIFMSFKAGSWCVAT